MVAFASDPRATAPPPKTLDDVAREHDEGLIVAQQERIVDLEQALDDLLSYARTAASELSDPGTGLLCAIHNAADLLGKRK